MPSSLTRRLYEIIRRLEALEEEFPANGPGSKRLKAARKALHDQLAWMAKRVHPITEDNRSHRRKEK